MSRPSDNEPHQDLHGTEHIVSNESKIEKAKSNLPLPEDPPGDPGYNTADARPVGEGSGRVEAHLGTGPESTTGLRGPATNSSQAQEDMSKIGMEGQAKESGK